MSLSILNGTWKCIALDGHEEQWIIHVGDSIVVQKKQVMSVERRLLTFPDRLKKMIQYMKYSLHTLEKIHVLRQQICIETEMQTKICEFRGSKLMPLEFDQPVIVIRKDTVQTTGNALFQIAKEKMRKSTFIVYTRLSSHDEWWTDDGFFSSIQLENTFPGNTSFQMTMYKKVKCPDELFISRYPYLKQHVVLKKNKLFFSYGPLLFPITFKRHDFYIVFDGIVPFIYLSFLKCLLSFLVHELDYEDYESPLNDMAMFKTTFNMYFNPKYVTHPPFFVHKKDTVKIQHLFKMGIQLTDIDVSQSTVFKRNPFENYFFYSIGENPFIRLVHYREGVHVNFWPNGHSSYKSIKKEIIRMEHKAKIVPKLELQHVYRHRLIVWLEKYMLTLTCPFFTGYMPEFHAILYEQSYPDYLSANFKNAYVFEFIKRLTSWENVDFSKVWPFIEQYFDRTIYLLNGLTLSFEKSPIYQTHEKKHDQGMLLIKASMHQTGYSAIGLDSIQCNQIHSLYLSQHTVKLNGVDFLPGRWSSKFPLEQWIDSVCKMRALLYNENGHLQTVFVAPQTPMNIPVMTRIVRCDSLSLTRIPTAKSKKNEKITGLFFSDGVDPFGFYVPVIPCDDTYSTIDIRNEPALLLAINQQTKPDLIDIRNQLLYMIRHAIYLAGSPQNLMKKISPICSGTTFDFSSLKMPIMMDEPLDDYLKKCHPVILYSESSRLFMFNLDQEDYNSIYNYIFSCKHQVNFIPPITSVSTNQIHELNF